MNSGVPADCEARLRRRFRWGAGWLLLNAGAHLPAHWRLFLHPEGPPDAQRAVIETLRSIPVRPELGGSLWQVLGAFSLSYALLLALLGTACWVMAREESAAALRRHAWRIAVLSSLAVLLLLALHPLLQPLLAFAGAALLFLAAALTAHPPRGTRLVG